MPRRPATRATADADDPATDSTDRGRRPVGRPGVPAQQRELRTRGRRTMRRLLDAAVDVFAARGYHAARVDDVVKRARTSHGTFYLYFANKEDLFRALTLDVIEEMTALAAALDRLEPGEAGRQALHDWVAEFADLYGHYGAVVRTWTEVELERTEFGQLGNQMFTAISGALTDHVATSGAIGLDPEVAALALLAMVERFHYYAAAGQFACDRDEVIDLLADVVHASLFGTQPPGSAPAATGPEAAKPSRPGRRPAAARKGCVRET